jgi:hypothetical protein
MECTKNGECLIQCRHKLHNGYCPSDCCSPIECRNFNYCRTRLPKWVADRNNDMCTNCSARMGHHTYTDQVTECCVCSEKSMIVLTCKHTICNDCWYMIVAQYNDTPLKCPLCHKND